MAENGVNSGFGDILIVQLWPWNQAEDLEENNMLGEWEDFAGYVWFIRSFIAQSLSPKQSNTPWSNGPRTLIFNSTENYNVENRGNILKGIFLPLS